MSEAARSPIDQATRDLIASDFGRNFLVEAGAGSGKTYSLAMRMAAGIERGAFEVDGMAAVTFTRKAAAELRGRFQEALEKRLREAPGEAGRARLQQALDRVERLFAGTIHSFCAHLLRERPVDAQVAPGFVELGDTDDLRLRKQAWRDYVVERRAAGFQPLLDLLDAGVRPNQLDASFAAVCEHEDVDFDRGSGKAPDPATWWEKVDGFWAKLKDLRPPCFHEKTTCQVQLRFDELEGRIRLARRERPASLAAFLRFWARPKLTQCYWGREVGLPAARGKEVKALVEGFAAGVAAPYLEAWHAYVHHLAVTVLLDARGYYAGLRRRQNAVNYVDLLRVTARLLRERGHVRRALQAKYRWLFVDEFQDTDPIQAEIFLMLAAGEERGGPERVNDPFALRLRPGSLFVVGDPKQSIFRFRRADIDIYNRVAARICETGGDRLSLTANFRSLPGVCALANDVFPPLFAQYSAPWSPVFEALDPSRTEIEGGGPRVATLTLPRAANSAETVRQEAAAIAGYIKGEVASGRRRHGDFLVLTRFRTRLPSYVEALDAVEIPAEVSGAGFFSRSPEIKALALLLAALADPLDAVSLVGLLRGPLFGISDPELYRFRQAGGRFELRARLPEPGEGREARDLDRKFGPVLDAMRRLQEMQRLARSLPLGAALDSILEETGWLALAATRPGGAPAGHLLQAVDRVRAVVEEGGGLADAAEALEEEQASGEAEALPLEPGRSDVVRLMNLHKAKGLEAPVVILADATHDFEFPVNVRVVRSGTGAAGFLSITHKQEGARHATVVGKPVDWDRHEEAERKYLQAERLRLLYVAATRAEEQLVVCRSAKDGANKAWREFEAFLQAAPEIEFAGIETLPEAAPGDVSAAARMAARRAREAAHARAREASWGVGRVTGQRINTNPNPNPNPNPDRNPDPNPNPNPNPDPAVGGAEWGTLIHGLLEHAARDAGATRASLERLARWLTLETPALRQSIPAALDLVEAVRKAPFWSEVHGADEVSADVPFAVRIAPGQSLPGGPAVNVPTVVHGVIDLAYRAGAGWQILDYKTDRSPGTDRDVVERHGPQLAQYAAAWLRTAGGPVVDASIALVREGRTVRCPLPGSVEQG